jgi:hypothetical protein
MMVSLERYWYMPTLEYRYMEIHQRSGMKYLAFFLEIICQLKIFSIFFTKTWLQIRGFKFRTSLDPDPGRISSRVK